MPPLINCVPSKKIGNATNRLNEVSADDREKAACLLPNSFLTAELL